MKMIGTVKRTKYSNTDYEFYESTHQFDGKEKNIKHFIYNLHQ